MSIVKIEHFALETDDWTPRAADSPDAQRRAIHHRGSLREDVRVPTKWHRRLFTAVLSGGHCSGTMCARRGRAVEGHAQFHAIPQAVTRQRTSVWRRSSGRERVSWACRAVTIVRTECDVSDPSDQGGGSEIRRKRGVAHAPSSPFTIIRAASPAAQNAAAVRMSALAQPVVRQLVATSVSPAKPQHQHRRPPSGFAT